MLPKSKQSVITTTSNQNIEAAKKSALQADIERQARLDAEEREKLRKGGGGGGGGAIITRGGGVKFGSAQEIQSSFIAQNYRSGVRADITKQIMQANTYSDNAATANLAATAAANGAAENTNLIGNNMANNLVKAMLNPTQMLNANLAGNTARMKNILDDFNNPIPRFLEGAISVLASTKLLKSKEELRTETEDSNEDDMEEKEELVESAMDKLTKLFPILHAMNDTDYNGNGVFQSIKIRTSKIVKFIFNREKKRNAKASRKDINKLKKLIKKNLDKSQELKENTSKLKKSGFFANAAA